MSLARYLAVSMLLFGWTADAQVLTPGCNSSQYGLSNPGDPSFPVIPDQYAIVAEITVPTSSRTFFINEYFDQIGNRARIDATRDDLESVTIADYNDGQEFIFPDRNTGRACTVNPIVLNSQDFILNRVLGVVPGPNDTVHIGPSNLLFRLINSSNSNFMGVGSIRGISANHWESCYVSDTEWYLHHFYFSSPSMWSFPYSEAQTPLFVSRVGQMQNSSGDIQNFNITISYVRFQNGSDAVPDSLFQVPTGLPCRGRKEGKPLPSFPRFFSTQQEVVVRNSVFTVKVYYDLDNQLIRFDGYMNSSRFRGPFSVVHDFNSEVQFLVNRQFLAQCVVQSLNTSNAFFDGISSDEDSLVHLRNARDLILAGEQFNYSYEGVTTIRGVQVEGWSSLRDNFTLRPGVTVTNGLYEIFFTQPGMTVITGESATNDRTLWRVVLSGNVTSTRNGTTRNNSLNFISDFVGFSSAEPPVDAFDVSSCFQSSDYVQLNLALPVTNPNPAGPPPVDLSRFSTNVRNAILNYASSVGMRFVSPLQVNAIKIVGYTSDRVLFSLRITNTIPAALVPWRFTAQMFVDRMMRDFMGGSGLPIVVDIGLGQTVRPMFISTGSATTPITGFDPGAAVGLAIGMFLLGLVVAVLVSVLVCALMAVMRKRQGSFDVSKDAAVDYGNDDDKVNLPT